ncbi:MAG TPA: sialate O-acetylesterase [Gemmataceae bacterium]|nr:sialate O-acetylesterase [Gemmataceae bacterium]
MKRRILAVLMTAAVGLAASPARADVKPHALFTDGMVLQRGMKCPVWGTADPGESVSVAFAAAKANAAAAVSASVNAGKNGKWRIDIQVAPEMAGGPYTMTIKGKNTITLKDVYVGDVWICSGQSNMEWPLSRAHNAEEAIKKAKNPKIRLFTVQKNTSDKPLTEFKGQPKWQECNPDTVKNFTAVGYFFGRDLQKALDVPIGLIHTSWGGTVAEAWTTRHALESSPELKGMIAQLDKNKASAEANYEKALKKYEVDLEKHKKAVAKAKEDGKQPPRAPRKPVPPGNNPNRPCVLYNAMIHPLQPYAIKGAIWYQGESNAGRAYQYRTLFPTMIQSWRETWKQGDFPFFFVQLAPFKAIVSEPQESAWAELREAQLMTSRILKHTGMAVITDVGDPKDIHPKKKEPVGARLALAARGIAYGQDIEYSGPVYDKMSVKDGKAVLHFQHVGKGLQAKDGPLTGFTIAGVDRKFYNAKAEIQGDTVLVWCDKVTKPAAVRYGWANCPVVNLWNKDGLPASPFRTDDFPGVTAPKSKQASAR